MSESHLNARRVVFSTDLGWMALLGADDVLRRLTFGHPTAKDAEQALGSDWLECSVATPWNSLLQRRLRDYAAGRQVEFEDVPVAWDTSTDFAAAVLSALCAVRYGRITTYGSLAAQAGAPNASRAVGNLMAANPVPLVVPCHRVLYAGGQIGHYSAPGGAATKKHLLEMERTCAMDIRTTKQ